MFGEKNAIDVPGNLPLGGNFVPLTGQKAWHVDVCHNFFDMPCAGHPTTLVWVSSTLVLIVAISYE